MDWSKRRILVIIVLILLAFTVYAISVQTTESVSDDFLDQSKISSNRNLYVNTSASHVRLATNTGSPCNVSDLVGWWRFDEGSNDIAYDSSDEGNDGVIYGATWVEGRFGKALSFDGVDDCLEVPDASSLDMTDEITIESWVRLDSLDAFQSIVSKSFYNLNGYRLLVDSQNKVELEVINAMDYLVTSYDSIGAGWHHLAVTFDGYNGRIFQDGEEVWAYLPNDDLTPITYHDDAFSDSSGNRVWPWGIEVWAGYPDAHFHDGEVRLVGFSADDAVALAIPDFAYKPRVQEGLSYTQSFKVKLEEVRSGFRLIHQWIDSASSIIRSDYGPFENGTSDWHTISLTSTAPADAVRGDIIAELYGSGAARITEPKFYLASEQDRLVTVNAQPLSLAETTDHLWRLNGVLDEVRIYNRALTAEEIASNAKEYPPSGMLYSTNLLANLTATEIYEFACNATKAPHEKIQISFSQDNHTWHGSNGTLNSWDVLQNGVHTVNLRTLGWRGGTFYYRVKMTSSSGDTTPTLDSTSLIYSTAAAPSILGLVMISFVVALLTIMLVYNWTKSRNKTGSLD